jgi:multiple sugar transport system substrate-binding protein
VDPKTDKSLASSNAWMNAFNRMKQIYEVPGNVYTTDFNKAVFQDQTVAMLASQNTFGNAIKAEETSGYKWDVTTFPEIAEYPKKYPSVEAWSLMLGSVSKHKDDAYAVIEYLLSPEVQTLAYKAGNYGTSTDPEIRKQFGADVPGLKGKNVQSIFRSSPAPLPIATKYDNLARPILISKFNDVAAGKKDVNTALREADEELTKKIQEEKSK